MRDDDARGTWTHGLPFSRYPHLNRRREKGTPHSFRRHLRTTLGWMCTVFIASTVFCIEALRAALDLARQRGYEAAKFMTSA
jgi:hypothetical protein